MAWSLLNAFQPSGDMICIQTAVNQTTVRWVLTGEPALVSWFRGEKQSHLAECRGWGLRWALIDEHSLDGREVYGQGKNASISLTLVCEYEFLFENLFSPYLD